MASLAAKCLLPILATAAAVAQQGDAAVVHGRAIDRDGKPVAGCAVGVFELGERFDTAALLANPVVTTDAEGRYRIEGKRDAYQAVVVATKGHQICVQRLPAEAGPVRHLPDALMLPGTTLRGRVRDAAGKPLAGALVRVEDPLTEGMFVATWFESQAVSNERGIFEVPGVPPTGLRVTASAPGFPAVSRLAAHDSPLDLTLTATGLVRGRVVEADGKPVANVLVQAITVERRDSVEQVVSDGQGRFTLTAPRAFRFRIAAYEQVPPHRFTNGPQRQYSSALLRGPEDGVEVALVNAPLHGRRQVRVLCVDARTKARIEDFRAAWSGFGLDAWTLLHRARLRPEAATAGEATVTVSQVSVGKPSHGHLLVEAPGHGFAFVAVPDESNAPMLVELPAECVLVGQVIDDATGKPAGGCAVRALPRSTARMVATGPDPWQGGAITDAEGRYRIGGLAAGDYDVQVYGVHRQGAMARRVKVTSERENTLDLVVPKAPRLEFELVGDVPEGCLGHVSIGGLATIAVGDCSFFEAPRPALPIVPLGEGRVHKLGPLGSGEYHAELHLPARARLGSVLTMPLGGMPPGKLARLELPDLRQVLHSGRVLLPSHVPAERIAVLAHRHTGLDPNAGRAMPSLAQPFAVCLATDGTFVIDLPPGRYTLQLVDLETRLVFHTEEHDRTFGETPEAIQIRPSLRWLTIDLVSEPAGSTLVLHGIEVDVQRAGNELPALFGQFGGTARQQSGFLHLRANEPQLRWLVPTTAMTLKAMQTFDNLSTPPRAWEPKAIDSAAIDATASEPHVTFRIPAPPHDATLMPPPKK